MKVHNVETESYSLLFYKCISANTFYWFIREVINYHEKVITSITNYYLSRRYELICFLFNFINYIVLFFLTLGHKPTAVGLHMYDTLIVTEENDSL